MGASGVHWSNVPHETILAEINGGAGAAPVSDAAAGYRRIAATLRAADQDLRDALSSSGASWEGRAAADMQTASTPLAAWADEADQLAVSTGGATDVFGDQFATTRAAMPAVVDVPAGSWVDDTGLSAIPGVTTDRERAEAEADAAQQEAARRMEAYDNASYDTVRTQYFSQPPTVTLEVPPPSTYGGPGVTGTWGSTVGGPSSAGAYPAPGGWTAPGGTATPVPSAPGSWSGPGGTVPSGPTAPTGAAPTPTVPAVSGGAYPGGTAPGGTAPGGGALPPAYGGAYPGGGPYPGGGRPGGRPGSSSGSSGLPGGAPLPGVPGLSGRGYGPGAGYGPGYGPGGYGPGGYGGGFGPGGSGGAGVSGSHGPGGLAGFGDEAPGQRGAAGPGGFGQGAAGAEARAARAGLPAGYGAGFGPGAGGRGEEDTEHRRPGYLVETEDVWGDGTRVAPPVIGERPV